MHCTTLLVIEIADVFLTEVQIIKLKTNLYSCDPKYPFNSI